MGFNFGAFAGAAANTALNTYERLGEEELRDMQRKKLKQDMEQEAALDRAFAATQGRVGQTNDFTQGIQTQGGVGSEQARMLSNQAAGMGAEGEQASAQSAIGTLRENAKVAPTTAAINPTEYTQGQANKDYLSAASGISRKGAMEALQMKSAMRTSSIEDKFDNEMSNLNQTLARIHGTAESGGLKGLFDAGKQEGLKLNFVEGKNGVGSRIQVLGPKGDVLETISDIATATQKLSDAAMGQFMNKSISLLGSPDKVIAAMQGNKNINLKEREVGVKEAIAPSEISKNYGAASYYTSGGKGGASGAGGATERILAKADELAKDKTSKFYGKREQAFEFLKRGVIKDDDAITWNDIEKKLRGDGASAQDIAIQRQGFFGPERGYAPPQAVEILRLGKDPKTGNTLSDAQLNEFNRKFPKTPWQDILGEDNKPQAPAVTQKGGIPVPR